MRVSMIFLLLFFPSAALADFVIMGDLSGMATESPGSRGGVSAGIGLAADSWVVGPIAAGPDIRVGTGATLRDTFAHGGVGAHVSFDLFLRASLAIRVGAGYFDGSLTTARQRSGYVVGHSREGVAPFVESDLTLSLPIGPTLAGLRLGQGRFYFGKRETYAWETVGLALGLKF